MTEHVILQRLFFFLTTTTLIIYFTAVCCFLRHLLLYQPILAKSLWPHSLKHLPVYLYLIFNPTEQPSQLSCLQFPMSYNLSSIMIHS